MKVAGLLVFAFALLVGADLTYSTIHGYMIWWLWSMGPVAVDGSRQGYIHINREHSAAIITRTDCHPPQSYLVALARKHWIIHCGKWQAPQFPAFPIGDVNPPCSIFSNGAGLPTADDPIIDTLKVGPRSVEFHTIRGHRVSASW